jgi:transposase InsO family protein
MVNCSNLASRSPSRRLPVICVDPGNLRRRAGGHFCGTMPTIAAADFFVLPTINFQLLFGFVIVHHGRRQWLSFGVTSNPTAEWLARQLTEAFPWDQAPRYLIRDRDKSYGQVFLRRLHAMGIRDRPIAPRSPWQNAYAERLIGSIRRECLDQITVFGEAHLRRILTKYADYNESRTHRSLEGCSDPPRHSTHRQHHLTTHPRRSPPPLLQNLIKSTHRSGGDES